MPLAPEIIFETHDGVLSIIFNKPEVGNVFNGSMAKALAEKLKNISEDRAIRAVLLRGVGKDFMVGHDLRGYTGDMNAIQDQVFIKVQYFYNAIREIQSMEKPVICAVQGKVASAGLCFLLASDLVVASKNTVISGGFTNVGLAPDGGVTFLLPRKVGLGRAAELLMLNEDINAEKALNWGLVTRLAEEKDFDATVTAFTAQVASSATRALGATKRLLAKGFEQDINAQLSLEAAHWNTVAKSFDFREGIKALVANRPPRYTGA